MRRGTRSRRASRGVVDMRPVRRASAIAVPRPAWLGASLAHGVCYIKLAFNPTKLWISVSAREHGPRFTNSLRYGGALAAGPTTYSVVVMMAHHRATQALVRVFGEPRRARELHASWRMGALTDLMVVRDGVLDCLRGNLIAPPAEVAALTNGLKLVWAHGHKGYPAVMRSLPDAILEASLNDEGDALLARAFRYGAFGVCTGVCSRDAEGWLSPVTIEDARRLIACENAKRDEKSCE